MKKRYLLLLLFAPLVIFGAQKIDNIVIDGNTIKSADTNGDIAFDPDGTGGVVFSDLTATTVPYLDSNKAITSSAVTPTELGKLASIGAGDILTTTNTKTVTNKSIDADDNTITDIDNDEIKAAAGIAVNKLEALTANRAVFLNASGFLEESAVTDTELTYLDDVASSLCGINDTCTQTNKTFTSPVLNTGVSGTAILDEDNMATDSNTQLATQQSIKAYADTKTAKATLTTKGDIYAASAASTPARVAVGSDGQVLTADSGAASGVSWQTPSSSAANLAVSTKTGAYTLTTSDDHIICDVSGGGFTLDLPTASGNNGKVFYITKPDTDTTDNECIVDGNSTETIEGETTKTLKRTGGYLTIVSDGTGWQVLNKCLGTNLIEITTDMGSHETNTSWVTQYQVSCDEKWVWLRYYVDYAGATSATTLYFDLPAALTIDTSRMADAAGSFTELLGQASARDSSGSYQYAQAGVYYSPGTVSGNADMFHPLYNNAGREQSITNTAPVTWGAGDHVTAILPRVPISAY